MSIILGRGQGKKSPLGGWSRRNPKQAAAFFLMALVTFFLFFIVMPRFHWG